MRFLPLFLLSLALASPGALASLPSATALPPPPPPAGLLGSWSTAHVKSTPASSTSPASLLIIDPVAGNSLKAPAWLRLDPGNGFFLEGSQPSDARLPKQIDVVPHFTIGVDFNPNPAGIGSQTIVWLFGFCELRYESESARLSMIVWQSHGAPVGDTRRAKFTRVERAVTPGKWNRVVAEIVGDKIRLRVNDSVAEAPLPHNWELSPKNAPVLLGNSGDGTRPFFGRFDHLFFTVKP